jgi:hypothetical protein
MGMAEDMQMLQYLQQNAGHGQMPQQGMQQPMGGMPEQQQQMQQEMPQQQPQRPNPLQAGSMAAVEAAKRSLEMSENENRRALGRAMIGMMSGMSQAPSYGQGLAGNLGALTAGFAPALSAYDAERDRIMQMNHALQIQQKQEEMMARKEEREMKRMAHDLEMEGRKIKVAEGYLGLERTKHADEKAEHEALSKIGTKVPISTLGKGGWEYAQKEIKSYIDQGEAAHHALETIGHVKKILKDDPGITKNMATILLAAQRHDPSIVRQKLNSWFIPEKTRMNAEMLSKHLSNLYTSKLKGFSPRGMNMFLEKQLREGNIDTNMDAPGMLELAEQDEEALQPIYKNGQEVYDELEKGNFYRPRPQKLSEHKEPESGEDVSHKAAPSSTTGMTEAQKQARIQQLLKMREMAPE